MLHPHKYSKNLPSCTHNILTRTVTKIQETKHCYKAANYPYTKDTITYTLRDSTRD